MSKRPHPSGKPVRTTRVVGQPIMRVPDEGPVTPRLQRRDGVSAIGFTASIISDDEEQA